MGQGDGALNKQVVEMQDAGVGIFITRGLLGVFTHQPPVPAVTSAHGVLSCPPCFSGRSSYKCAVPAAAVRPFGVHPWRQDDQKADRTQQSDNRRWQYMFREEQACEGGSGEARYEHCRVA